MASLAAKIAITICLTIFSILVLTIFFVVIFDQLYDDENYNYNKHHITMSDIAQKVKQIIVDKLGVDESEVTNEASFTNDLGADSLDTVELIMEFEKEFDVSIPDEQAENIQTVGDAVTYLASQKS